MLARMSLVLALAACTADVDSLDDGPSAESPPPDDYANDNAPLVDDGYVPHAVTATRFGVFYQVSTDVLDTYQDAAHGLPATGNHAWIITESHATKFAARSLADLVHRRADFYYAPAFDLWDASHDGWETASDSKLALWAHQFRDVAIAAHADLFTLNECPSTTAASANVRVQIAAILRHLHEPDAQGRRLSGIVYFTEKPGMPANWSVPASDFFAAIDETSVALVVEHYHSNGFVCGQSEAALASHFFALRDWLASSGEPAKVSIANTKFTILHSARFAPGTSGWSGGNSSAISLSDYQKALSRAALVTRETAGGNNRLAFGPTTTQLTLAGIEPRIAELFRWHYAGASPAAAEQACVGGAASNCECE
jgi:hypothetical protein